MLPPGHLSIAYIAGRLTPKVSLAATLVGGLLLAQRTRYPSDLASPPSHGAADLETIGWEIPPCMVALWLRGAMR